MSTVDTDIRKIKLFPLFLGASGCDYHRVKLPYICGAGYWDDEPFKGYTIERSLEFMCRAELVLYNRQFPGGPERLKRLRDKHGFKVVCDLDDWVELPGYHPNYKQYKDSGAKEIIENLKAADMVTVTTDRLYKRVKEYNSNTHVIPNAIPFSVGQFVEKPDQTRDNFDFIYTGQSSHLEDVRIMQADIRRSSKLPGISFSMAGYKPNHVWPSIEKVFNQGAKYNRIPARPLDSYMSVYDHSDCSLVPLCVNDFNAHKSNLKLLEAGCKKIPCIVSDVLPYRDNEDAPVLWVKNQGDWYNHIKFFNDNRNAARVMGQALYEWTKLKYDMRTWNQVRYELYQTLLT